MSRALPGPGRARTSGSTPRRTSSRTARSTRDGRLEAAMAAVADWAGRTVLDLGCGTGFHLPRFAATAALGVRRGAAPRPGARWPRGVPGRSRTSTVSQGTAQALPLPDASVDVVHARWAYFFGPGCEPGLAELDRVVRRGGTAFVIDNDADPLDLRRAGSAAATPTSTRWPSSASGRRTAGPGPRSTSAGRSRRGPTSRASSGSSSRRRSPTRSSPSTTAPTVDYAVNLWSRAF